jgi:hypothetical protein
VASQPAVEFSNAAFFAHGLGERARPRALSGAPRARLVEEATGLRPHFFQLSPRGRVLVHPRRARSPGPRRCRAIFCSAAASISVAELGTSFDGGWRGLAGCGRNFKCCVFRAWSREAAGPEAPALPALPRHFLRRSRLDFVAELGTSFDGVWRGLAGCGRNFKCRVFRAWSREAAGPEAPALPALPRHFLRRSRLATCSGTRNEFRRRLARPRGMWSKFQMACFSRMVSRSGGSGGPSPTGAAAPRRSRLDSCSGTRNEFRRRLARPRELWSKFQMPRFSCMVSGSAPALGRCRVRPAPDLSKNPPACGRIFFNSAREGACWCTRGRARSPRPRRCRAIFCGAAASIL